MGATSSEVAVGQEWRLFPAADVPVDTPERRSWVEFRIGSRRSNEGEEQPLAFRSTVTYDNCDH